MAPNVRYKLHVTKQPRVVRAGKNIRWVRYRDSDCIICNFGSLTGRYL